MPPSADQKPYGSGHALILGRLALLRLRRRWPAALAVGLGLAAAVGLATSATLVQSVTSNAGLQATVRDLGVDAAILLSQNDVRDEAALADSQETGRRHILKALGSLTLPGARYAITEELVGDSLNGMALRGGFADARPRLGFYEDLEPHIELVAGRLPGEAKEGEAWWATTSQAAATTFNLRPGDRYCVSVFNRPRQSSCVKVAAVWRPRDGEDPYWGPERAPTTALLVGRSPFFQILSMLPDGAGSAKAVYVPSVAAVRQSEAQSIYDGIQRLRGLYTVRRTDAFLSTKLDTALADFLNRLRVAQFAIQILVAQIVLIAIYYVAFAVGHVLELQRPLFGIWQSRGWDRDGILTLLMLEFGILACLAVPVGLASSWIGVGEVTRLVYAGRASLGLNLDLGQIWPPVAGALALMAAILAILAFLASGRGLLDVRRQTSRPATRGWWQWRSLDLALATLSLPLLAEARILGRSELRAHGAESTDPVSLFLVGIAATLLVTALLRLLPAVARGARLVWHDLSGALASWQLTRQPIQHARLCLLLTMAVAVSVFASANVATAARNAADRAAYAAGADLRAHFGGPGVPPVEETVESLRGIEGASFVFRGSGRPGLSTLQPNVLAIDPATFQTVARLRRDLAHEPLPDLIARLASEEKGGLLLPGEPDRIGLWVHSSGLPAELRAVLVDGAGRPCQCRLGSLDYTGWRYLQTPIAFASPRIRYPLRLREIAVRARPGPSAESRPGVLAVSDLGVKMRGSDQAQVIEAFAVPDGWWQTAATTGLSEGEVRPSSSQPREGRPTVSLKSAGTGKVLLRPPPSLAPVPALAPGRTLTRLGIHLNQPFALTVGSATVQVVVVGRADHFPTLYPETQDFLVAARDPLLARLGHAGFDRAWPNEAWLKVGAGADVAAVQSLRAVPGVTEIWDRPAMETRLKEDPLALGLTANLLVGFVGALALGLLAFLLHFLVTVRGRLSEYAILQANGLPEALIRRSLSIEQWVVLAFSLGAGTGVGLLLSWVLLPALELEADPLHTVPPTVVSVDLPVLGGALLAICILAVTAGQLVIRVGRRFRLMEELRLLG